MLHPCRKMISLSNSRTPSSTWLQTHALMLTSSLSNHWTNQPLNTYQQHTVQIEFFSCHLRTVLTAAVKLPHRKGRLILCPVFAGRHRYEVHLILKTFCSEPRSNFPATVNSMFIYCISTYSYFKLSIYLQSAVY